MTNKTLDRDVERRPEEETPLLAHDLPATVAPSRAYQFKVIAISMIFIVIVEVGALLQVPPTYQIMEQIICEKRFPGHIATDAADDVCKGPEVAGELAMVKGWLNSFDCIPPLITSIPYGIIADKYGRRPVLTLAMFGLCLEFMWMLQPLLWPNVLPLWTVWFGAIFQFIGGGAAIVQAMVWTMISDVVPISNLTSVYYKVGTIALTGELVVAPISAALLTKSPWLPLCLGQALLTFGACLPPFIPETSEFRRAADVEVEQTLHRAEAADGAESAKRTLREQIVYSMKNDMNHVYNFLIKSKRILPLVLGFNLTVIIKYIKVEITSQYVHNLFGWSWAKASRTLTATRTQATLLGTVSTITNMTMLLAVLPFLSWYITKRTALHPLIRDLWLVRMTGIFLSLGCFMVAVAYKPWFLIAALVIFSMGATYTNICRAVLNAVVEPHTIGTLNTAISWVEQLSTLVSAPVISALLRAGTRIGGAWVGLPYMAATVMAVCGTVLVFGYHLPGDKLL
ncbi:major facilitator superfamily transporter [Colletotrichum kahawae]|uniref:Major facilitator superfamily transporter n=1 Tax=Colletotrichum kahawae TaxID=34407 RepID=A0AAD9XXV4_COLKA|nr:major facilitator superfamily transporter [Colletotrichum kahawae]